MAERASIEDDSAVDGQGSSEVEDEGASGVVGDDILDGIDTVSTDEEDQFSGFLKASDDVKVDELSVDVQDVPQEKTDQK